MTRAIVYCQLQHDLPRCFWTSLKKARELWAGDIYLIAPQRELGYTALKEYDVKFIAEHTIESDLLDQYERHTFFEKIHPGWDGFWDNACKRFIYLYELQRMENIDELLHFETDVVPYIDIENMFKNFGDAYRRKIVFSHHAPLQLSCCTIYCNAVEHFEVFSWKIIPHDGDQIHRGEKTRGNGDVGGGASYYLLPLAGSGLDGVLGHGSDDGQR